MSRMWKIYHIDFIFLSHDVNNIINEVNNRRYKPILIQYRRHRNENDVNDLTFTTYQYRPWKLILIHIVNIAMKTMWKMLNAFFTYNIKTTITGNLRNFYINCCSFEKFYQNLLCLIHMTYMKMFIDVQLVLVGNSISIDVPGHLTPPKNDKPCRCQYLN